MEMPLRIVLGLFCLSTVKVTFLAWFSTACR